MTKQLNFPFIIQVPDNTYAVVKGTNTDTVTFIGLDNNILGRDYVNCYTFEQVIKWIGDGSYTVLGLNPITDIPEPEVTVMSLKIETDASELTNSLREANEQATKLSNTLRGIKELFNN